MITVRTRFAPSPTGTPESIHLGFVIRALWNYAYAKKNKGKFVLRIEDTDTERSRKDTEEAIYAALKKFNIEWDEGPDVGGPFTPYRQSERLLKYKEAAKLLVEKGYAYYDFDAEIREKEEIKEAYESEEQLAKLKIRPAARNASLGDAMKRIEDGEKYVVRVKIPENRTFEFEDWILKKKIKFEGKEVSDMILLKSDGFPTYHLAVVVDDIEMQISHVLRGQEWITSTPIHLYLYEGMDHKVPEIGHFTVILDPQTGKKFSKRDLSAMFGVETWLKDGYLPEAILNYLMLLGWAPKDNRELFTLEEFVQAFDRDGIQKANPVFDARKLDWFNGQYIRKMQISKFKSQISKFYDGKYNEEQIEKIAPLIQQRIKKLSEFEVYARPLFETPEVKPELLKDNHGQHLEKTLKAFEGVKDWNRENLDQVLAKIPEENQFHRGDYFMNLRISQFSSTTTVPINDALPILGKEEVIKRIKNYLK